MQFTKARAAYRVENDSDHYRRETFRDLVVRELQDRVYDHAPASAFTVGTDQNTFATTRIITGLQVSKASLTVAEDLLGMAERAGAVRRQGPGVWRVLDGDRLYDGEFDRLVRGYDIDPGVYAAIG
jgi:hypothetical protein